MKRFHGNCFLVVSIVLLLLSCRSRHFEDRRDAVIQEQGRLGSISEAGAVVEETERTVEPETVCPKEVTGQILLIDSLQEVLIPNGFNFLEGPTWHSTKKRLYLSAWDVNEDAGAGPPSAILQCNADACSIFSDKGINGTNGLENDGNQYLYGAFHDRQEIARVNIETGARESLVATYNDLPFNSPNDLTLRKDGGIYFTDPNYQRGTRPGQPVTRIYFYNHNELVPLGETILQPNGVLLSPDESRLFVSSSDGAIYRYPLDSQGLPTAPPAIFAILSSGIDGMAQDCQENIYATVHTDQKVVVLDPNGLTIQELQLQDNVTNVTFGGDKGDLLYITTAGKLWKVQGLIPE